MAFDSLQNYVSLVSGVSRATRERAATAARSLLAQAGLEDAASDASEWAGKLAEDILNARRANREMLENLVGREIERAARRLGFARVEQVADLQAEVAAVRARLDQLDKGGEDAASRTAGRPTAAGSKRGRESASARPARGSAESAARTAAVKRAAKSPRKSTSTSPTGEAAKPPSATPTKMAAKRGGRKGTAAKKASAVESALVAPAVVEPVTSGLSPPIETPGGGEPETAPPLGAPSDGSIAGSEPGSTPPASAPSTSSESDAEEERTP